MARKTNFRWYWKNQYGSGLTQRAKEHLSLAQLRVQKQKRKTITVYYVNFEIEGTRGYVVGSLTSNKKYDFEVAKNKIRTLLPRGYKPVGFYEAEEEGEEQVPTLTLIRNEDEVIRRIDNV